jgi:hypothetical protein
MNSLGIRFVQLIVPWGRVAMWRLEPLIRLSHAMAAEESEHARNQ